MAGRALGGVLVDARRALAAGTSTLRVTGLRGSAPALFLARLAAVERRPVIAIVPDAVAAETFVAALRFYLGDAGGTPLERRVHLLPGWDVPPFEPLSPSRETLAARAEGLYHLLHTPDPLIVTTPDGWGQRCVTRETFRQAVRYLVTGERIARDEVVEGLLDWGYHRVPLAQDPGDVAVRGGILDVFPAGYARPVRLELLGDEIERIRTFDPSSQRSEAVLEEVLLLPVREFSRTHLSPATARIVDQRAGELGVKRSERVELVEAIRSGLVVPGLDQLLPLLHERLETLAEHLPPNALVWMQGPAEVEASAEEWWRRLASLADAAAHAGHVFVPPAQLHLDERAWRASLATRPRLEIESLEELAADALRVASHTTDLTGARAAGAHDRPLAGVASRLQEWTRDGARLVVVASSVAHRDRM